MVVEKIYVLEVSIIEKKHNLSAVYRVHDTEKLG